MTTFANNIISLHGDCGRKWLENLDTIVANLSHKQHLTELTPLDNLTFNYVMRGIQNEIPIVLKIGFELDLLKNEAKALKFFENCGAVKLLDSTEGALLLECCIPGTSLKEYFPDKEKESLQIASRVIKRLHSSNQTSDTFCKIEDLLLDLNCHSQKAKNIAEYLLKTTEKIAPRQYIEVQ